ncbi:MAG: hypothetical protein AB1899_05910 [Pseudomonadota bacterium]
MGSPCDILKRREIVFHPTPPGQVDRALELLAGLPALTATRTGPLSLQVAYCVADYTLEGLENGLAAQGFHLEGSLLIRIRRSLAYYSERVQRDNMGKPEHRTKNYQAHMEAWNKRPHGDHDETPLEWRQYK